MSVRILQGDVLDMLRTIESESVQCVVTSPPYFGLRAYGTAPQVWGGDPDPGHAHEWGEASKTAYANKTGRESMEGKAWDVGKNGPSHDRPRAAGAFCPCGAWRGELGSEPTPALFIEHLLLIFDEVRRVLRPDGLVFCNIGDSYVGHGRYDAAYEAHRPKPALSARNTLDKYPTIRGGTIPGIPAKNLLLIPQRFAIGMQDRGWWVRSEIVWAKTSAMPESVRDRPTSAWEPIWMFAKSQRYFYDGDAVRQPHAETSKSRVGPNGSASAARRIDLDFTESLTDVRWRAKDVSLNAAGANLRNVWLLGPEPSREQHFASFVTEIPRRCILAGTSERGACSACGAPWVRTTSVSYTPHGPSAKAQVKTTFGERSSGDLDRGSIRPQELPYGRASKNVTTTGWAPSCSCDAGPPIPQTVLDPFAGSFTTCLVAERLGRDSIGIELSPAYVAIGKRRIETDAPMLTADAVTVADGELLDMFAVEGV